MCVCVCVGERQLKIRSHLCEGEMCCISLPSLQLFFHSGSTVCVCVSVTYMRVRACVCVCVTYTCASSPLLHGAPLWRGVT